MGAWCGSTVHAQISFRDIPSLHLAHLANDYVQTVIVAPPMEIQSVSRLWRIVSFLLCTHLLIRTMQSRVLPE